MVLGGSGKVSLGRRIRGGPYRIRGGNSAYTYYTPEDDKYKNLIATLYKDIPSLLPSSKIGLGSTELPAPPYRKPCALQLMLLEGRPWLPPHNIGGA